METLKPIFSPPSFKPSLQMTHISCFLQQDFVASHVWHSILFTTFEFDPAMNTSRNKSMIAIPCIGEYRGSECFLSVAFHLTTTKVAHVRLLAIARGPIDTILTSMLSAPLLRNIMGLLGWYEVCICNGGAVQWNKADHIEMFFVVDNLTLTLNLNLNVWIWTGNTTKSLDHHWAISIKMCLPLWRISKECALQIKRICAHIQQQHENIKAAYISAF